MMDWDDWNQERDVYLKNLSAVYGNNQDTMINELAFHLTEIGSEVNMLNDIHERLINAKDKFDFESTLDEFYSTVCIHWQYHINELKKMHN